MRVGKGTDDDDRLFLNRLQKARPVDQSNGILRAIRHVLESSQVLLTAPKCYAAQSVHAIDNGQLFLAVVLGSCNL